MARAKPKRRTTPTPAKRGVLRKTSASPVSTPKLLGKNLERAVRQFQAEPDDKKAHEQWKQIESSVFGVQFED
ncbi:MAG: hypothetical protein WCA49_16550 [Candidatus Sulfotelmatobacter sp.]